MVSSMEARPLKSLMTPNRPLPGFIREKK